MSKCQHFAILMTFYWFQAEGMKKLAEELLKIESNARRVEAEKAQLEADCR